jgi:hypothetical protein
MFPTQNQPTRPVSEVYSGNSFDTAQFGGGSQVRYPSFISNLFQPNQLQVQAQIQDRPRVLEYDNFNAQSLGVRTENGGLYRQTSESNTHIEVIYPLYPRINCDNKLPVPVPCLRGLSNAAGADGRITDAFLRDMGLKPWDKKLEFQCYLEESANLACMLPEKWYQLTFVGEIDLSQCGFLPNQCGCASQSSEVIVAGLMVDITGAPNPWSMDGAFEFKYKDGYIYFKIREWARFNPVVKMLISRFIFAIVIMVKINNGFKSELVVAGSCIVKYGQNPAVCCGVDKAPKEVPCFEWIPQSSLINRYSS